MLSNCTNSIFLIKNIRKSVNFKPVRLNNICNCTNSKDSSNNVSIKSAIRSAQAIETFRSNFYKSSNNNVFISLTDIEQILVNERVRPSLLISFYQNAGFLSGKVASILPSNVAEKITTVVDEAAIQQLNDSVRNLQGENIDVRETLKFHRDIRYDTSNSSSNENTAKSNNNGTQDNTFETLIKQGVTVASTGLYQIFKISENI